MSEEESLELLPCPFCGGTDLKVSSTKKNVTHWCFDPRFFKWIPIDVWQSRTTEQFKEYVNKS